VNFLGLGKIAAIPAAWVSNLWHLFYTNVLPPERHTPPISILFKYTSMMLFTPDKFYENRKIASNPF
jgi:hypothetical protein